MRKRRDMELKARRALFLIDTRLGFVVRTTRGYWTLITSVKHPSLPGKERVVMQTLSDPDEVRVSKVDRTVYLFYRRSGRRHLCVVTKRIAAKAGFIVTAYFTDKIKEGQVLWKR